MENQKFLKCPKCGIEATLDKVEIKSTITAKEPALREDFQTAFGGQIFLVCKKCQQALLPPQAKPQPTILTPQKKLILPK